MQCWKIGTIRLILFSIRLEVLCHILQQFWMVVYYSWGWLQCTKLCIVTMLCYQINLRPLPQPHLHLPLLTGLRFCLYDLHVYYKSGTRKTARKCAKLPLIPFVPLEISVERKNDAFPSEEKETFFLGKRRYKRHFIALW